MQALAGERPSYLARLEKLTPNPDEGPGAQIRALLKGDCHTHSDWSDGGSPIDVMAAAARDLGHDYIALTDHSPRLTIAHGLSAERLLYPDRVTPDRQQQMLDALLGSLRA